MQIYVKTAALRKRISILKNRGLKIGFVPTMGALHEGHIALIKASIGDNDITICSIFVNPTQFNNKKDLQKYPRTKETDIIKLNEAGTDILFHPDINEVYPEGTDDKPEIDLRGIDKIWEGEFRPGHFAGVVQVVKRLLDIVVPDALYMGQKDFQQYTIIAHMLKKVESSVLLKIVPTIRENDGLAMSSRNVRLTPQNRINAVILYQMLSYAKANFNKISSQQIEKTALNSISEKGLKPEYFKIVSIDTLTDISMNPGHKAVAIVAAWAGDVRLIDNMFMD
ncbi:MAG: pantoate--beta-alanine ligase [Deltaproteobacteria bacterium]